ncbi:MAG: S41 family peptidase [Selenomonadaceae bacterium]|nr:S41 family peptidase [Selenomonadaceae bacterium]
MKKKIFAVLLLTALISSALTVLGICFVLNLDAKSAINLGRFLSAMNFIELQYVQDVDKDKLIDGAISGMVRSLGDPHSVYLEPKLYSQLKADTSGAFGGIGVYMGFKDNGVQILNVIPDGPGDRSGLKAGDSILAVNSEPVNQIEYGEVALKIRGEVGTSVELLVHREGEEDKTYTITREIIKVQTVSSKMLDDILGYIRISNFSENTGKEFKTALNELESANMKGLILDLRQNPGGVITSCVEVAREIVPKGPIVSVIQRDGTKEVYTSDLEQTKFPIVVLLDQNSASAAELLSGALQDTKAAVVVGKKSYGKGSVQTLIPMFRDDGLKLTVAKYYTPNGRSIDGVGIIPDVEVSLENPLPPTREINLDLENDAQLRKAEEILSEKVGE